MWFTEHFKESLGHVMDYIKQVSFDYIDTVSKIFKESDTFIVNPLFKGEKFTGKDIKKETEEKQASSSKKM